MDLHRLAMRSTLSMRALSQLQEVAVGRLTLVVSLICISGCAVFGPPADTSGISIATNRDRSFRHRVENWDALRSKNVVFQDQDYSCGAAALATILQFHWDLDITEAEILEELNILLTAEEWEDRIENGLSITDLRRVSEEFGLIAALRRVKLADLRELKIPVIVRIFKNDYEHFVVYRGIVDDRVFLADPISGNGRMSAAEFQRQWNGVVLAVVDPDSEPTETSPLLVPAGTPAQPEWLGARQHINRPRLYRREIRRR